MIWEKNSVCPVAGPLSMNEVSIVVYSTQYDVIC